jgi:hypothetical protein
MQINDFRFKKMIKLLRSKIVNLQSLFSKEVDSMEI